MYYHLSYCVLSKYHACEQEDGAAAHHIYATGPSHPLGTKCNLA